MSGPLSAAATEHVESELRRFNKIGNDCRVFIESLPKTRDREISMAKKSLEECAMWIIQALLREQMSNK